VLVVGCAEPFLAYLAIGESHFITLSVTFTAQASILKASAKRRVLLFTPRALSEWRDLINASPLRSRHPSAACHVILRREKPRQLESSLLQACEPNNQHETTPACLEAR
jgi:hypothetical protein